VERAGVTLPRDRHVEEGRVVRLDRRLGFRERRDRRLSFAFIRSYGND
jgi:hypothetical protein